MNRRIKFANFINGPLARRQPTGAMAENGARQWPDAPVIAAVAIVSGLFFSVVSPFGAVNYLPWLPRALYWAALVLIVAGVWLLVRRYTARPVWQAAAITATASAPLVLAVIIAVQMTIGMPVPPGYYPQLLILVWLINAALCALFVLAIARRAAPANAAPTNAAPEVDGAGIDAISAFRAGLPQTYRNAEIYALQAEDHYVRVHTDRGEALILARLRDAEAAFQGQAGAKPHRSWLVLKNGVDAVSRRDGKLWVALKSGAEAPVSRAGARNLREAGWVLEFAD